MDNLSLIKEKLKSLLNLGEVKMNEDVKMSDSIEVMTKDGIILSVNDTALNPGSDIFKMENGVQMPIENGDYELEDGSIIVVMDGKISEVKQATAQSEEVKIEEGLSPDMPADVPVDNSVEERITNLENKINEIVDVLNGIMNQAEQMSSKVQTLSAQPASNGITNKIVEKTPINTDGEIQKIKDLLKGFKKDY